MTAATVRSPALDPQSDVPGGARVAFRQPVESAGFVDAAWWPRSTDLRAELPALLDVLWTAGREITRVTYNSDYWGAVERRIQVQGRMVRVGGYQHQNPLLLGLVDAWGNDRLDVLVIPPETDEAVARRALHLAAEPGGTNRPERIMELARLG